MAPRPIPVELVAHDPRWSRTADREADFLASTLGELLITVHHIGSTAIPDILAKPIVDLIPVVRSLTQFDASQSLLRELGYEWWGELGLLGRRYCTKDDAVGRRFVLLVEYVVV